MNDLGKTLTFPVLVVTTPLERSSVPYTMPPNLICVFHYPISCYTKITGGAPSGEQISLQSLCALGALTCMQSLPVHSPPPADTQGVWVPHGNHRVHGK